jgi:hypothetical protein
VFASVQLVAPGAGDHWFGADYAPDGWTKGERGQYLLTELVPLVGFMLLGVLFWALGKPTRTANSLSLAKE